MKWLLVGHLTPSLSQALLRHGHAVTTLDEAGINPDASPSDILSAAHHKQLDVLTNRPDLANLLFEHPVKFIRTLVYLQLKGEDVEQDDAIDRLFQRYKRLTVGRLYTVTETRVKVRQLPGH